MSVVLPVRDAAGTIGRAIASIRHQTFPDWELLVIDDGSADGTADVARAAAQGDPRVLVMGQARRGLVAALNAGLALARADLVARMDADDEAHRERLAAQVAYLASPGNDGVGVVGSLVAFGGTPEQPGGGYALHVDWLNTLRTPEDHAVNRFIESPVAHPSVMFRRDLLSRHGGYREGDFPEDYELWLRWLDAGVRMAKVPRTLLTWHDTPARLSRTDARYRDDAFFLLKAEWIARELQRRGVGGKVSGGRALYVWGAGRHTRKRAALIEQRGVAIAGYVDVDRKKTGRGIGGTGRPVLAPEDLPPAGAIFVLGYVSTRGAREDIRRRLAVRGYVESRDFLMGA